MMLQPMNIFESRLNEKLLHFYNDDLIYKEVNRNTILSIGEQKIISCSAWWDPSYAASKGDASVLAIIFTDENGVNYLHHVEYIDIDHIQDADNESNAQCNIVSEIVARYYCPSVTIEVNGVGTFLPEHLKAVIAQNKVPCAVKGIHNHRPKNERILEAFDALLAAQNLYVHDSVRNTPFIREMMEWNPASKNNKDDGLDAVAGALNQEPVRIKRVYSPAVRKWAPHSSSHTARTNFDV